MPPFCQKLICQANFVLCQSRNVALLSIVCSWLVFFPFCLTHRMQSLMYTATQMIYLLALSAPVAQGSKSSWPSLHRLAPFCFTDKLHLITNCKAVFIADCSPLQLASVFCRQWPGIFTCCRSYLEQSASAHHLGIVLPGAHLQTYPTSSHCPFHNHKFPISISTIQ